MVSISKNSSAGNILENSQPPPNKPRFGGIRSVTEIGGKAYAVGSRGMVYRLDKVNRWVRIDNGLPDSFDIEAIHGFDGSDIYTVGDAGKLWHFDGKKWKKHKLPTNLNLNTVKCAGNGEVYVAGSDGILIRGKKDKWESISHDQTEEDIWDLEWFEGNLYISTMEDVFRLTGDKLKPVDFGKNPPKSSYQLSTAKDVLWSVGEYDVMTFNGKIWTRII